MKSPLLFSALAVLLLSAGQAMASAPESWMEDYAKALEQAKVEHKKVLLVFMGSDWCNWCKLNDVEILETPKFKAYAAKNLVLVKVDFPHKVRQSKELKAQNQKLQVQYDVSSYPTLIMVNDKGKKTWEQAGYRPGGVEVFLKAVKGK